VSWLRLDDSIDGHPKFAGWTDAQKWKWIELMCWSARQRTNGWLGHLGTPAHVPTRRTREVVDKAISCGLIDVIGDELWIHDWALYNGDLPARVAAYCAKYPQASANEVQRFTGGTRSVVLELVRSYRSSTDEGGSDRTTETVRSNRRERHKGGSEGGSGPHPQENPASKQAVVQHEAAPAEPAEMTSLGESVEQWWRDVNDDTGGL